MHRVIEDVGISDSACVFPRQLLHTLSVLYHKRLLFDSVGVFHRRQCCQLPVLHRGPQLAKLARHFHFLRAAAAATAFRRTVKIQPRQIRRQMALPHRHAGNHSTQRLLQHTATFARQQLPIQLLVQNAKLSVCTFARACTRVHSCELVHPRHDARNARQIC